MLCFVINTISFYKFWASQEFTLSFNSLHSSSSIDVSWAINNKTAFFLFRNLIYIIYTILARCPLQHLQKHTV